MWHYCIHEYNKVASKTYIRRKLINNINDNYFNLTHLNHLKLEAYPRVATGIANTFSELCGMLMLTNK